MRELDSSSHLLRNVKRYVILLAILWTVLVGCLAVWHSTHVYDSDGVAAGGGVSVGSESFDAAKRVELIQHSIIFLIIWVIGISGIFFSNLSLSRNALRQKEIEDSLRESEARHRVLTENLPQRIFHKDVNSVYVSCNHCYAYELGILPEEIIGKSDFDFFPAEFAEKYRDDDHRIMELGETVELEESYIKDGQEIFIQTVKTPLKDDKGIVTGILGIFWDISQRKQAQEALIESTSRFRELMHQSPVVFELYDLDGVQTDVNEAYEKLWGFPASHTVNKFNVLKSKEVEDTGLMVYVKKAYAGEAVTVPEYEFDSSGKTEAGGIGRKRWLSTRIFPLKDKSGQVETIVISHEDVTDRKATEENLKAANQQLIASEQQLKASNQQLRANEVERESLVEALGVKNKKLQESEAEFRSTIKDLLVGVIVHGSVSGILLTNPEAENILGLTHDQLMGKTAVDEAWSFVHEDSTVMEVKDYPVSKVFSTKEPLSDYVLGVNRPDRDFVTWLTVNAVPVLSKDGEVEKVIVNFIDITARRSAELRLQASDQQLRASNQQLNALNQQLRASVEELERAEQALEKRMVALTSPLDDTATLAFEDLFNLDDIQRLQDEFSDAVGVASLITAADGTPITAPSNFCRLCNDIIRKTEKGCENCFKSDATIGRFHRDGPVVQPCLSGGLWDAGASISVGGKHVANWLIGQVRDETQTVEKMREYARQIGADEDAVADAFEEVTSMSHEQFERVAQTLFTLSNQLSFMAYQNVQQGRFIAERKAVEKKLKDSERRTRALLENSPICTKIVDLDLNLQYMSSAGIATLKVDDVAECYGKPYPFDFFPDSFKGHMISDMKKVIETGDVVTQEAATTDSKGNELWIHSTLVPVNNDDGQIDYLIVASIETTARKIAELGLQAREQQLRASNQQLRANEREREVLLKTLEFKNRELQDIVYTASHDLKSPLVNISGFSGYLSMSCDNLQKLMKSIDDESNQLKMKETIEKEIPESLGFITSSVVKMKSLIDGLLRISRIGTVDINSDTVDMNELLWQVRGAMEFQLQESVGKFDIGGLPDCKGDRELLNQVFTNLIDNAIKYRDSSREMVIAVSGKVEGGEAIYCVRDNGIGVDMNFQGKIFEIFHRLNPDGDILGEGLGLTIVTRIVDRLGGRIWMESEAGVGCSFFVALPKG